MNALNLTYIKYFCDAVRCGSIAAAAKANFVTQPAISQGIAKLESLLNVSLLAHHPNRFRITPVGEALFKELLELLKHSEEVQSKVSNGKMDYMGDLVFSCTYSFSFAAMTKYLQKFVEAYPHVKIKFSLSYPYTVKDDIRNGKIDFGIVPDEGDLDHFGKKVIYPGKFRFYTALGKQVEDDPTLRFILTEENSKETIYLKRAYFRKFKKELTDFIEIDSWEMIAKLTAAGLGIGYLPDYFTQERSDIPIQEYKLDIKTEEYQMVAIHSKGIKLRKSSEVFLACFT